MDYKIQREQMMDSIVRVLKSTGEFGDNIIPGYVFSGDPKKSYRDGNIYCELIPQLVPKDKNGKDRSGKFLITLHSDLRMSEAVINKRGKIASEQGIYSIHILNRYINSGDALAQANLDDPTNGPLFQRRAYAKPSLSNYPSQVRNNFRDTTKLEREFIPNVSHGTILYFQPKSERLEECVIRYRWKDVFHKGTEFTDYEKRMGIVTKEPIELERLTFYTLSALLRDDIHPNLMRGDIIGLPNLLAETAGRMKTRRQMAALEHMLKFNSIPLGEKNLDERKVKEYLARIEGMLRGSKVEQDLFNRINAVLYVAGGNVTSSDLEEISEAITPFETRIFDIEVPETEPIFDLRRADVESRTRPVTNYHRISVKTDRRDGKETHTCSCEAGKKGKLCWPVKDLIKELNKPQK
jgi:hypothetical protein